MPSLRRILFIVLTVVIIAIAISYYRFEFERIAEIRDQIAKSEAVLNEKRESVRSYKEKVAFYKTNEGAAHLAREQYNLIEKGERVVILQQSSDHVPVISNEPEF